MARSPGNRWKTLDKDLHQLGLQEDASNFVVRPLVAPGLALGFIVLAALAAPLLDGAQPGMLVVVAAAAVAAYMALNIGAKDVANYMGPAVGAGALRLGTALAIAAIAETAGALIAGSDVIGTVATGILVPGADGGTGNFVWAMMAALLAAALWIHLAIILRAPVSTTHSIIGGIMGAGIAAAGPSAVQWDTIGMIALTWLAAPFLGAAFAAAMQAFVSARIIETKDRLAAARLWVPILIGVMAAVFVTYLGMRGLNRLLHLDFPEALALGCAVGISVWAMWVPLVRRQTQSLDNRRRSMRTLFAGPLVAAAALLSFGHGANDVANAVGPLAAIVEAVRAGGASGTPVWVIPVGALGMSVGLLLFGPRMIRLLGSEITRLNPARAYCIALSTAVTVITAAGLGLPVSTTHIAVGGIFGIGFYREWRAAQQLRLRGQSRGLPVPPEERSRRRLVRRAHLVTIIAAWIITVPVSAVIGGLLYSLAAWLAY